MELINHPPNMFFWSYLHDRSHMQVTNQKKEKRNIDVSAQLTIDNPAFNRSYSTTLPYFLFATQTKLISASNKKKKKSI